MSKVSAVDTNRQPLHPVHLGRARLLLRAGKAAILKRYPFTTVFKYAVERPEGAELRVKIDPGSKITGLAIVNDAFGEVVFAAELSHRGDAIKKGLDGRCARCRWRRQRKRRYRKARFTNRRRRPDWLAPSLESRIANILTWVHRLCRLCPISDISMELVKFDTQLMENPDIEGIEYQ